MITKSALQTQEIGFNLAQKLKAGDVVCLYGDLGYGKTTFVQGMAKGLGIKKRIISPTFVIVRTYKVKSPASTQRGEQNAKVKNTIQKLKAFYHIDLYRINSFKDIKGLGLQEILNDMGSIKIIEWPEELGKLLPKKRTEVYFEYIDENTRKITIKNE